MIKVTIYNEYEHERVRDDIKAVYPEGMHKVIADFLGAEDDIEIVKTVTVLDLVEDPNAIDDELLANTDVMLWWGHVRHRDVPDAVAERVQKAVLGGMGMVFLHSGHYSKPFRKLMGTECSVYWREDGDSERVWVVDPNHPIAQGLDRYFELEHEETYSEPFRIPEPDRLVFIGNFSGGEVFRSGCCYVRGAGKIFYFQPGHEAFPTFYNKNVQTVIKNAVRWAAPTTPRNFITNLKIVKITK